MKNLMLWIIGYTVLEVESTDLRIVLNLANKFKLRILNIEVAHEKVYLKIFTYDEKRIIKALDLTNIKFFLFKRAGIVDFLKKYVHRIGIVIGALLFLLFISISPKFIWEIEVLGVERLSEAYILELLKSEGVCVGAYSPSINRQRVYASIVSKDDNISWITVNFIGAVAKVEVSERDYAEVADINADAANIVAKKDGQILDTKVENGRRTVTKGDVVKKGDVLISGIYDTLGNGTRYVYAQGEIYAAVCDEFVIEVPLENYKKVYTKDILQNIGIKLFEKNIIFYKNYSNLESNYDTISKEEKLPFLNFKKLPFSIVSDIALCYEDVHVTYTEEEAVERARRKFYDVLDFNTEYVDMISVEESYVVDKSVLIYSVTVEAVENIASTAEFQIN